MRYFFFQYFPEAITMRQGFVVLGSLLAGGGGGGTPHHHHSASGRLLYDHVYHAGNYADVVKHGVLISLLRHMQKKPSPMVYAETHAGAGAYRLRSKESRTLSEHERGIDSLFGIGKDSLGEGSSSSPIIAKLLELVKDVSGNKNDETVYPGSPLVASSLCRDHDSLLLCEKEPGPFETLESVLGDDERATLLRDNGYKALRRFENIRSRQRALVFVDPPYQMGSDTEQTVALVKFLQTHWRSARVAIWHPVSRSNRGRADRLYRRITDAVGGGSGCGLLATELHDESIRGIGTGMLLVNPPHGIDKELGEELLPLLGRALGGNDETIKIRVEHL